MMLWSPWVPQRACIISPWAGLVAAPVEGPLRCTSMMTAGISDMMPRPLFSCIREIPGPLVAVYPFFPVTEAPSRAAIELISSSIWI